MVMQKQEKIKFVEELKKEIRASKVVATASLQNLPAKHLNSIKKKIGGKATLAFGRSKLLKRALAEANPEASKELLKYMVGNCAIMLANESVFGIAKVLRQSKSKTKAKPGQLAPSDIIVQAGETSLPPGPVLTELKQAGIQAKIQGPKVVITADAVVARKGEPIKPAVVAILSKLSIEPMEVGMSLKAAYEDGMVFTREVLDLDDQYWLGSLALAHQQAVNLSVKAEIFNKYSTELLIQKAAREANALQTVIDSKSPAAAESRPAEATTAPESEAGTAQAAGGRDASAQPASANPTPAGEESKPTQ